MAETKYNTAEAAIHLDRYLTAKQFVTGKHVLDIACGEGYGSKLMKDWGAASVVGVDISSEALQIANQMFAEEGITFLQHTAEELPFESQSFDVIVSYETVEHLDHPEKFLEELARLKKADGVVIISCPNDQYYADNEESFNNPFHKRRFSWFDFKDLAEARLGSDESWYFGFGLRGFSTLPLSSLRLPESAEQLPKSMTDMFSYTLPKVTAMLPAERYLNYWNACYFIGIWGPDASELEACAAMFPEEVYIPSEEKYKLYRAFRIQQHENEIFKLQNRLSDANKEMKAVLIEKERTSNLLKISELDQQHLWTEVSRLKAEESRLKAEESRLKAEVSQLKKEMNQLKEGKAVRILFGFWRVRDKVLRRK